LLIHNPTSLFNLLSNYGFKIIHIKVLGVTKTRSTIRIIAVHTKEAIFMTCYHCLASHTFAWLVVCIWSNHTLSCLNLIAASELIYTFRLGTNS